MAFPDMQNNMMSSTNMSDEQNLQSLFTNLNTISQSNRAMGTTGGGSEALEGNMDANRLIGLNPYMDKNVTSFNKGGQLSPAEYKKVASLGRFGDTQLAHVTPEEANMLRAMGGSGTINPYTGLRENFRGFRRFVRSLGNVAGNVLGTAANVVNPITQPVFDAAGNVVENVVAPVVDVAGQGVEAGLDVIDQGVRGGADLVKSAGFDVVMPAFEAVARPIAENIVRPVVDMTVSPLMNLIMGRGEGSAGPMMTPQAQKIQRGESQRQVEGTPRTTVASGIKPKLDIRKTNKPIIDQGDFVGNKPNPYLTENVEEELDYAEEGMKFGSGKDMMQLINEAATMKQIGNIFSKASQESINSMAMQKMENGGRIKKRNFTNGGRF